MTTGQRLLKLREAQHLKQSELANKIGITEATLSRYENDKRMPTGDILLKLANELNVSIDYLLDNKCTMKNIGTMMDIEELVRNTIYEIETKKEITFCNTIADREDRLYLKEAYLKLLMDIRVYNKKKYLKNKKV